MDRHLNAFVPYDRDSGHEDQLTRAAMIVLRAVPLAREVLLTHLGLARSPRLPEPEIDMQTQHIVDVPDDAEADATIGELVSVFLTPDMSVELGQVEPEERPWGQRLDGVLRFGDEVVILIESKINEMAPSDQVRKVLRGRATFDDERTQHVAWHDLIEDWWSLVERGVLAPAERLLIEDMIDLGESSFPRLMPFTTLARAGNHPLRLQRRLKAILETATDGNEARGSAAFGAMVRIDEVFGTSCTQRLVLHQRDDELELATWPAELKPQARAFYRSGRVEGARALAHSGHWTVEPNLYLGYRGAHTVAQRLYPTCQLTIDEYLDRLTGPDFSRVGACPYGRVTGDLWPWLKERGYAHQADDARLPEFLDGLGRRDAHLRPSVAIRRTWPWSEAEALDESGGLVAEIREAIIELLTALNEPAPSASPTSGT